MKSFNAIACATVLAFTAAATPSAHATPVTWTISGLSFGDGGAVSGSFSFDAATDTYTSWDITTTATLYPYKIGFQSLTGSTYTTNAFNPNTSGYYLNPYGFIFYATDPAVSAFPTKLIFQFAAPLTDAGGTVALTSASEIQGFASRSVAGGIYLNGGTLGTVSSVPEPTALSLAGAGLAVLVLASRRRASAARSAGTSST